MSLALTSRRAALMPGQWVRNELWRRARAVPSLDLRFADNKSLVDAVTGASLLTFTRASSATYVDSQGVIQTAVTNVPRFDHNPTTGESLGLLVEEARTNLALYSQHFSTQWGSNTAIDVIENSELAPDGTFTASKAVVKSGQASWYLLQTASSTPSSAALTVYAKASGWNYVAVGRGFIYGSGDYAIFDLLNGTITRSPSYSGSLASITAIGNGWYRCVLTSTQVTADFHCTPVGTGSTVNSGTPNGVNGVLFWGAQLEAGSFPTSYIPTPATFTSRSSTATYYDSAGIIQTAGSNVARSAAFFPDSNGTMQSAGLLLEAAGTNYSIRSEDTSLWDNIGGQTTNTAGNVIASPDGNTTADNIYGASGSWTAKSIWSNNVSVPNNSYIVTSVFAKKVPSSKYNFINLNISFNGGGAGIRCNLSTGEVINAEGVEGYSQKLPNGWYRFVAYLKNTTGSAQVWGENSLRVFATTTSADAYGSGTGTGSTTDGVYLWGKQSEANASPYATSYIPTTTATVTRAADVSSSATVTRSADVASITGTNFSSWYRQGQGTIFTTYQNRNVSTPYDVFKLSDGTGANVIAPNNNANNSFISTASTQVFTQTTTAGIYLLNVRRALAYAENNTRLVTDSEIGTLDTSVLIPVVNKADIFTDFTPGVISRIAYWPTRLPDATLQNITK